MSFTIMAFVQQLGLILAIVFTCGAEEVHISKQFATQDGEELYSDWWQDAILYQIYPRSFKDSNKDGDGDLQGIIEKLDHFTKTGISGVWLSPIYKSPQVDNGYDISDYRDIESMYGTLSDLKELLEAAHSKGLKVILDYVPNHTSDQHEWFLNSVKRLSPYEDYYIWHDGINVDGERQPPNNWISTFRGSAWEWNEERQQYYFHQFAPAQPDLNYRNPLVVQEMKDVLTYWLDFGVDGFRMDAIPSLFEDLELRDEPSSGAEGLDSDDPGNLNHIYTFNLDETYDMVYQWRELLDSYTTEKGGDTRIMMTEVYADINQTMLYYKNADSSRLGAHFTFNFITFIDNTHKGFTAFDIVSNIFGFIGELPEKCIANWVLGNHDQSRVATRIGVEHVDFLNVLAAILPGVQITYQGEEIGQENGEVTCEQGYDPQAIKDCSTFNETSRDFERTPYQWDSTRNAGFSDATTTWLPVSQKYLETNLAAEDQDELITSHYNIYKAMSKLKKEFKETTIDYLNVAADTADIFYLTRETDGAFYGLIYNIADEDRTLSASIYENATATVALTGSNSQYVIGEVFDESQPLKPKELLVLKLTKRE